MPDTLTIPEFEAIDPNADLDAETERILRNRTARGVAVLDQVVPEWRNLIDTYLDLQSRNSCVWGQLADEGVDLKLISNESTIKGKTFSWDLGFDYDQGLYHDHAVDPGDQYHLLQEFWLDAITEGAN